MMLSSLISEQDHHTGHDQRTFRSLLEFEHRRCLRSGHALHVLLCRLSTTDGARFPLNESFKQSLMSVVRESLRKTDHLGWFLQDLVLGAVLVSPDPLQSAASSSREAGRIRRLIESRLSLAHPSLILQFYEYLDLPPVRQRDDEDLPDKALATLH
jgi:hypothetical protein